MGYATKIDAIKKVENHLADMIRESEEIVWYADDANKLRYLIHQAMYVAANNAHQGEPYATIALLRDKYKLRVIGNKVIAEPKLVALAAIRAQVQRKVVVKDIGTTPEIIAALGLHSNASEIVFDGVNAEDQNKKGLFEVAKRHGFYMIPASTHVTFSKNPEDKEIAWTPEEE